MSNRLLTISKYIDDNDKVVDVGCDHAKLSIILEGRGISSIASDVNENIIKKRKEEINSPLIDFIVSDGLKNIDDKLYDTVVCSGMGSILIVDIIKNSTKKFKKLITVSNKDYYYLRDELNKLGYIISKEEIIIEKGKYYNLIVFIPGKKTYTNKELLVGVNHQNIDTYKKYMKHLSRKYKSILWHIPKKKQGYLKDLIEMIESEI